MTDTVKGPKAELARRAGPDNSDIQIYLRLWMEKQRRNLRLRDKPRHVLWTLDLADRGRRTALSLDIRFGCAVPTAALHADYLAYVAAHPPRLATDRSPLSCRNLGRYLTKLGLQPTQIGKRRLRGYYLPDSPDSLHAAATALCS